MWRHRPHQAPALPPVQRPCGPRWASPEQQQHGLREGLEVVVPVYLGSVHQGDLSEHLQVTGSCLRNRDGVYAWLCPLTQPPPSLGSPSVLSSGHPRPGAKCIGPFARFSEALPTEPKKSRGCTSFANSKPPWGVSVEKEGLSGEVGRDHLGL